MWRSLVEGGNASDFETLGFPIFDGSSRGGTLPLPAV